MIIYITTNLINGKKYIGKDEKNNPRYLGSGKELKLAIKKYGRFNFSKEVICTAHSKELLNELEEYYIEYYNATKSELFYNIAPGGDGGKICKDYSYREIPVYEVNPVTFQILKEYKSCKEAAILNNLNYKILNAVCNNCKTNIKNRIFVFKHDYNLDKLKLRLPNRQKYITLSYKTGIYYYNLEELWIAEYTEYKTFSSFLNYVFKHKKKFEGRFKTYRI